MATSKVGSSGKILPQRKLRRLEGHRKNLCVLCEELCDPSGKKIEPQRTLRKHEGHRKKDLCVLCEKLCAPGG